jgi:hypothetical protein
MFQRAGDEKMRASGGRTSSRGWRGLKRECERDCARFDNQTPVCVLDAHRFRRLGGPGDLLLPTNYVR